MKSYLLALAAALLLCAATPAPSTTVDIANFAFKPDTLTVHVGDTVVFRNDDDVTHNVVGGPLNSGDIEGGKSWQYTFSKAGTYNYVCTYHSAMHGTITVQ